MKWIKWLCVVLFAIVAVQGVRAAVAKPYQISNRLRLEYDDNINQTESDKDSSVKVIDELEFLVNFNLQNTYVGLRYRPSYTWWDTNPTGGSANSPAFTRPFTKRRLSPRSVAGSLTGRLVFARYTSAI